MDSFWLTWQFLLDHPATAYIAPVPWHLLAVLVVLGLLAAGGLHHLLGYTYKLYMVPGGVAGWLAFPSLVVLLVSVQVLIAIYLMAALAPEIVRYSLESEASQASAMPIGGLLLSPAFSESTAGETPGGESGEGGQSVETLNRAGLNRALHAHTPKELREKFRRQLQEVRAKPISLTESLMEAQNGEGRAAPELLMLALHWAAEDYQDWPPQTQEEPPRRGIGRIQGNCPAERRGCPAPLNSQSGG